MLSKFVPLMSQNLIAENNRFKDEVIRLSKELKQYQNKIIQTLTNIRSDSNFLFQNPYELLNIFVEELHTYQSKSRKIQMQNQILLKQKQNLIFKTNQLENTIQESKRNQEFIIQQLNCKIQQKKKKLEQLQDNLQQVLQAKKVAEQQLKEIRDQMKILRLKLYEQQRQKVTQIIVANKKQMLQFRKNLEIESYKIEMQFKKQIQKRDKQIKTLFKNIEEIINNKLSSNSDLSVLQKIIKPLKDHSELNQIISDMKNELSNQKQELRDKISNTLDLQGKCADLKMQTENLKSNIQRLEIQKEGITDKFQETSKILAKSQSDKKAMEAYYNQRWQSQFSKVRMNLQDKYMLKTKKLEQEYERKKKEVQSTIRAYIQEIRIKHNQIQSLKCENELLTIQNQNLNKNINRLETRIIELKRKNIQNGLMHVEDLISTKQSYQKKINLFKKNISDLQQKIKESKRELQQTKQNNKLTLRNLNKNHFDQVQKIKKQCEHVRDFQQRSYEKQIQQLNTMYTDVQQTMQKIRVEEREHFIQKEKEVISRYNQIKKQTDDNYQRKIIKLTQKISENEIKFQKIRRKKQDQIDLLTDHKKDLEALLHQRQTQLIARDVQIQQYSKMKEQYMKEVKKLLNQTEIAEFELQSTKTMLESKLLQIQNLNEKVQNLKRERLKFIEELNDFSKKMKDEFNNLKKTFQKQIMHYKSKVWELQKINNQKTTSPKDVIQIQSLRNKNQELIDQIQIKQAENVVLIQIKDYYQNKVKLQSEGNVFINTTSSKFQPCQSVYVKRPSRKNMLLLGSANKNTSNHKRLHTSIHINSFQEEKVQSQDVSQMKKYLNIKQKGNDSNSRPQSKNKRVRVSSSLL